MHVRAAHRIVRIDRNAERRPVQQTSARAHHRAPGPPVPPRSAAAASLARPRRPSAQVTWRETSGAEVGVRAQRHEGQRALLVQHHTARPLIPARQLQTAPDSPPLRVLQAARRVVERAQQVRHVDKRAVRAAKPSSANVAEQLAKQAHAKGSTDNISAVVLQFKKSSPASPRAPLFDADRVDRYSAAGLSGAPETKEEA